MFMIYPLVKLRSNLQFDLSNGDTKICHSSLDLVSIGLYFLEKKSRICKHSINKADILFNKTLRNEIKTIKDYYLSI